MLVDFGHLFSRDDEQGGGYLDGSDGIVVVLAQLDVRVVEIQLDGEVAHELLDEPLMDRVHGSEFP